MFTSSSTTGGGRTMEEHDAPPQNPAVGKAHDATERSALASAYCLSRVRTHRCQLLALLQAS